MPTPSARLISCDEAGFTGRRMLDDDQPVFAYTAIDLTAEEAAAIVAATRQKYRVQAPELKAQGCAGATTGARSPRISRASSRAGR